MLHGAVSLLWQSKELSDREIVAELRVRYGSAGQGEKFRLRLRCRRRRSEDSPSEFAQEVERLTTLAYPEAGLEVRDPLARDVFIENLDNPGLTNKMREREPATLRDAVKTTIKLETSTPCRAEIKQKDIKPRLAKAAQETIVRCPRPGQSTAKQENSPRTTTSTRLTILEPAASTTKASLRLSSNQQHDRVIQRRTSTAFDNASII